MYFGCYYVILWLDIHKLVLMHMIIYIYILMLLWWIFILLLLVGYKRHAFPLLLYIL